jgi:hypoxanthine phosphoribosyltransferase
MPITKKYITADELLLDSFRLGVMIHNSGFKPDFIVGVWRGGTPVGIAIQEIWPTLAMNPTILLFELRHTSALITNLKRFVCMV